MLNAHALIPLLTAVVAALLAGAIAVRDFRQRSNAIVIGLLVATGLVSVCEAGWTVAESREMAMWLARLLCFGSLMLGPLSFHLIVTLAPELRPRFSRWLTLSYAATVASIAIGVATPLFHSGVSRNEWGWTPLLGPAVPAVYLVVGAGPAAACIAWLRHTKAFARHSPWIELGLGIPLLMATATNFLLPYFEIYVPRLAGFCLVAWGGVTWWAVSGHRNPRLSLRAFAPNILETLPDGVLLLRLDGRVRYANDAMGRLVDCPPERLMGRGVLEILSEPPPPGCVEFECEMKSDRGESWPVSVSYSTLRDDKRNTIGAVLVVRDLREVASLRSRLLTSGRLAAVGQLAAGIAHEINNPIAYVRSNLTLFRDHWSDVASELVKTRRGPMMASVVGDGEELIRETFDGVDRVAAIVRDVGGFSRTSGNEMEEIALPDLLERAVRIAAPQLRDRARIVRQYRPVPMVEGHGRELMQVFLNLLLNAVHALGRGGTIRLRTDCDDRFCAVYVEDDGAGIEPDRLGRIFEPFYTSKPVGVGTGLGLPISEQIVERHGGRIAVRSDPGLGTQFRVTLPISRGHGASEADPP